MTVRSVRLGHRLVNEQGFACVLDLGDSAFEVEGFRKNDLENLKVVSTGLSGKLKRQITFWTLML